MTTPTAHFWTSLDRLLLIGALLGAAFSAGYNYRGLDAVQKELTALQQVVIEAAAMGKADYARKDVVDANQRRLDERLINIEILLAQIQKQTR